MFKSFSKLLAGFCLLTLAPLAANAGNTLEHIKQTGVIVAGTRKDAVPFAYIDDKGKWVGYSVDILEAIRQEAQRQLGRPIKLKLVEANESNRFSAIAARSIDLECSTTTFTWERTKKVDFSLSYFAAGTQLLVNKNSTLGKIDTLAGKKIGVLANSTNQEAIRTQQPKAQLVIVKDYANGIELLKSNKIDGFAADSIVLEGLQRKNKNQFKIVPKTPYQYESYACMLPKDDSDWRNLVNYTLVKFMEGIINDQPQSVGIYEHWFGENGLAPYPRNSVNRYFEGIINSYEWIPLFDTEK